MGYLPVILSAGSIGTLQLLMLPGIGPEKDLQSIGTQTLVDLPNFFFQSMVYKATAVSMVLTNQITQALAQHEKREKKNRFSRQ